MKVKLTLESKELTKEDVPKSWPTLSLPMKGGRLLYGAIDTVTFCRDTKERGREK